MVGASDRILPRTNPEGNERDRVTVDEMEDYGEWLKSDMDATRDFSRLSSEEENLLGSFSTGFPSSGNATAGNESLPSPEVQVRISDLYDVGDENQFAASIVESEIDAEEGMDIHPLSNLGDAYDAKPALSDDFVLGVIAAEKRKASGRGSLPESETEGNDDDISEEFFEIDEEVSSQADPSIHATEEMPASASGLDVREAWPLPAREEIAATEIGEKIHTSPPESREVQSSQSRELADETLARIVLELSSIRNELIGIKAGIPPAREPQGNPLPGEKSAADENIAEAGQEPASSMLSESKGGDAVREVAESAEFQASPELQASHGAEPSTEEGRQLADPRFSLQFVEELRGMFAYMDKLLESLPDAAIEEFARSPYFDSYKRIFEILGIV
jgi:hypothetical protein